MTQREHNDPGRAQSADPIAPAVVLTAFQVFMKYNYCTFLM